MSRPEERCAARTVERVAVERAAGPRGSQGGDSQASPAPRATAAPWLIWDAPPAPRIWSRVRDADPGLRVMWWNIQAGRTNRAVEGRGRVRPLDHNLAHLAASAAAPNLLLLGEFHERALARGTMDVLRARYPVACLLPYNPTTPRFGIQVLSDRELLQVHSEALDYSPPAASAVTQTRYRAHWCAGFVEAQLLERQYARLQLRSVAGQRPVTVVPVHLLQPWERLQLQHSSELFKLLHVGAEVVLGHGNPLLNQARHLRRLLQRDFGAALDRGPLLVIGDFNLPKGPAGLLPGFRILRAGMREALRGSSHPSWPAPSSRWSHYPSMRLDHALTASTLNTMVAEVLPLMGSDHFALYLVVS